MLVVECAGGERFTYRGSWCAEGLNSSWECAWRAVGSAGSALWDGAEDLRVERVPPGGTGFRRAGEAVVPPPAPAMALTGHAGCIDEMLRAIRSGAQPSTCGADNIRSLAIIHAAIASSRQGGARVAIADL
jgi:predicted dehydrogenase